MGTSIGLISSLTLFLTVHPVTFSAWSLTAGSVVLLFKFLFRNQTNTEAFNMPITQSSRGKCSPLVHRHLFYKGFSVLCNHTKNQEVKIFIRIFLAKNVYTIIKLICISYSSIWCFQSLCLCHSLFFFIIDL